MDGGLNSFNYVDEPLLLIDALGLKGTVARPTVTPNMRRFLQQPIPTPTNNYHLRTPSSFKDLVVHPVTTINSSSTGQRSSIVNQMVMPTYYRLQNGSSIIQNGISTNSRADRLYNYSEFMSNYHTGIENAILAPNDNKTRYLCKSARISTDKKECKNATECLIYELSISDTKNFLVPNGVPSPVCVVAPLNRKLENNLKY